MKRVMMIPLIAAALLACVPYRSGPSAQGRFLANGPLPPPPVPADNPQTDAKIRLGMQLYFDKRLSNDNTISCASCHKPDVGWADPNPVSEGVGHAKGTRNAPTVLNSAYSPLQFWDGRAKDLEDQALGPIQNPVEMQMTMPIALDRLQSIPAYMSQFQDVFGTGPSEENVAEAIAAFERTVVSRNSAFDRYVQGDYSAMSRAAVRGMQLFNGGAHCTACHSGPNFSDGRFHNLGIGYENGEFKDVGRYKVTNRPEDMGTFKTPSLRNVALTAPYLHDGSEKTLIDVIDLYNRGGVPNPNLDRLMLPLSLTEREKADLAAFMEALTGEPLNIKEPELPR
jgi:cytochrome c peroxidase